MIKTIYDEGSDLVCISKTWWGDTPLESLISREVACSIQHAQREYRGVAWRHWL